MENLENCRTKPTHTHITRDNTFYHRFLIYYKGKKMYL